MDNGVVAPSNVHLVHVALVFVVHVRDMISKHD